MTRRITRRDFVGTMTAGLGELAASPSLRAAGTAKPNIVFLLSDDVGIDLMGCYGSDRFKTPNIDALAGKGIRFETCYSTPLCGPSRCQINTGRYPFRTGGLTNRSWSDPAGQGAKSSTEELEDESGGRTVRHEGSAVRREVGSRRHGFRRCDGRAQAARRIACPTQSSGWKDGILYGSERQKEGRQEKSKEEGGLKR